MFHESENKSLNEMIEIANRYQQELQIVHVENMLLTNEMLRVKDEWENKYPQAKIKIIKSQNIENGLLNYCTENKIDVLGIVHREMSVFERLFAINHSKRLLSNENVALLVFHESK